MRKGTLILLIFAAVFTLTSNGQDNIHPQTKEYATVYLKVYYQGNLLKYDKKGASKSPIMTLVKGDSYFIENHDDPNNVKDYTNLNEVLNYMAKYGWVLKSNDMMPYEGDSGNTSRSSIINTNEYMQILIFERDFIEEQN